MRSRFILVAVLALPAIVVAVVAAPHLVHAAGLVPCGGGGTEPDCTPCDFFVLLKNIFDFLVLQVTVPLATVMFMASGVYYLVSGANPQLRNNAKNLIRSAVVGVLIVLFAWTIISEVILFLAGTSQPTGFPWPWNDPQCTVQ